MDDLRTNGSNLDVVNSGTLNVKVTRVTGIPPLIARTYIISRTFLPIDTSDLLVPPITSFLHLPSFVPSIQGTQGIVLIKTTQQNSGTLETTDWSNLEALDSPTEGGSLSGTTLSTYWEMNNNFNSLLNYGGTTLLGIRPRRDVDDNRPTTNISEGFTSFSWEGAHSGTNGTFIGDHRGPHLDVLVRE